MANLDLQRLKLDISRKFGSFHSSNIEEQLKASEKSNYEPPDFPVPLPDFSMYNLQKNVEFGNIMKQRHFLLDSSLTFLNHGAFGCVLKEALHTLQLLQNYVELQPVRFIDRELFPLIVRSQKKLASFVGCKPTDIAFVENATMGTNVVLNSMNFKKSDTIYFLNTIYGAVKKSISQIHDKCGVQLHQETLKFPISSENDILSLVEQTLKPGTRLALFDHIPSNMPFVMPIKKLVKLCRAKGVSVLVDGAHALGSLHLNLPDLEADYYVTNAHKWFCAPKGCAILYVKPDLQSQITALSVSHGHGYGFQSELTYYALKDYSPYLAVECCVDFWNSIGADVIRSGIKNLLDQAVYLLLKKWNGQLLAPLEMHSSMACVSLPAVWYEAKNVTYEWAEIVQNKLFHEHSIEVPVKCIDGKLYVRVSCHIHNEIKDYEKLGDAILTMLDIFDE